MNSQEIKQATSTWINAPHQQLDHNPPAAAALPLSAQRKALRGFAPPYLSSLISCHYILLQGL